MKIAGKILSALYEHILVLPRVDRYVNGIPQEDLVLRFRPVTDWSGFNRLCPEPKAPSIQFPGQQPRPCTSDEDPDYAKAVAKHAELQTRWVVINSILATPGLTFSKVDLNKPETWNLFETELMEDGGLNIFEVQKVFESATNVNILTDEALKAARDRFLASQEAERSRSLSLQGDQPNTPSG